MSFCYYTRPLPGQQTYTGQAKHRGTRSSEETIAAVAARCGLTMEQVEGCVGHLWKYIIEQSMDCWRLHPILGYFGFQGTCGGSHPKPDFMPTFSNLAMDISLRIDKPALEYMKAKFQSENVGHHSLLVPEVRRVTNMNNGIANSYTPGKPIQVELSNSKGKLDLEKTAQGVFFRSLTTGMNERAVDYSYYKGSLIACTVPEHLTGPQQLSVSLWLNRSVRTGVWPQELIQVAATGETVMVKNGRGTAKKTGQGPASRS